MSDDANFVDAIAQLFQNPAAPSAGYLINPSLSDERRRELTRNALLAFPEAHEHAARDFASFGDAHKECLAMNHRLKKLNSGLIDANRALKDANEALGHHHDELHRLCDELSRDYKDLADEYTRLLNDQEDLKEKYTSALQRLKEFPKIQFCSNGVGTVGLGIARADIPERQPTRTPMHPPSLLMSDPTAESGSDDDDDIYFQPINHNASREELSEALKDSQLSIVKLLREIRQLRIENANLLATSSKKQRKNAQELNHNVPEYQSQIVRLAKKFLFTRALVVPITAFRKNTTPPPKELRDQFKDDDAYTWGITRALYDDTPDNFAKDFISEHGEGRSTLIGNIRKVLPIILNGYAIDSNLLTVAKANRADNDVLKGLLQFPNEQGPSRWPPALFPGPTQNMNQVFTGPIVKKIHRLMLFGPGSLAVNSNPAPNTNGIKLAIVEATPESLSLAGILVCLQVFIHLEWNLNEAQTRFVLSTDITWASKGAISSIEWEQDFRAYHETLACNRHLPHVKEIFKTINEFVFEGVSTKKALRKTPGSGIEPAIDDALRRFELGTDPDPDEVDDNDNDQGIRPGPVQPIPPPIAIVSQNLAALDEGEEADVGSGRGDAAKKGSKRGGRKARGATRGANAVVEPVRRSSRT
ncbi:hypothetical protein B0H19DRAFT_1071842 [Mycena capillaripes]|nr:hypothetical protein B0H19DRAFT_1071842 [Mycena capillaripes]